MHNDYPMEFTLENGTHVTVNKTDETTVAFTLKGEDGTIRNFDYTDEESYTAAVEDTLDFDQLNALRRYWLEREDLG